LLVRDGVLARQAGTATPAERESALVRDHFGGDPSALQASLARRYVYGELIAEHLELDIFTKGVTTGKGRTRAAVTLYLSVMDRLVRLAGQLGLERRSKRIQTAADIMREHREGQ
jgi:hypothetical protein